MSGFTIRRGFSGSIVYGQMGDTTTVAAPKFYNPSVVLNGDTTENEQIFWIAPRAGTLRLVRGRNIITVGAGETLTLTLRRGAQGGAMADTAITMQWGGGEGAGTLKTNATELTVNLGDRLSWRADGTGATVASRCHMAFEFA